MAIIHRSDWSEPWTPVLRECFLCGQRVAGTGAAVYWCGATGELILHVECAERLALQLIGDAREARLVSGEAPWRARAVRAVREALRTAEGVS